MDVLYPCCAGIDVHKASVVVCVRDARGAQVQGTIRTFGTTTKDLLAVADWLRAIGCTHVAMEATGVYWKPVYAVLEGVCAVLLVNAHHLKRVPGRKTDVQDAAWIAELLQHGLLRGSFVPPREQRDLRELTRYRATVVDERARVANRIQKVLEDAQLKLGDVASDVLGASGQAMLSAIADGETDPVRLARLARGRLRNKHAALVEALTGRVRPVHRFLLHEQLAHLTALDTAIDRLSAEIARCLAPCAAEIAWLDTIPGIGRQTAEVILAEIGTDLTRFGSAARLSAWAGLCPGQDRSAGRQRTSRTRRGNPWLRRALVAAAHGAAASKRTYFHAHFRRLAMRRGRSRAVVAVAHSLLVVVFYVLTRHEAYRDLGPQHYDVRDAARVQRQLVRRLERLGYRVSLQPAA
jgi:transposase